jgi:hypothetical protein
MMGFGLQRFALLETGRQFGLPRFALLETVL